MSKTINNLSAIDLSGFSKSTILSFKGFDNDQLQAYITEIQSIKNADDGDFGASQMQEYANALSELEPTQAAVLLSTQGLTNAQIQQTLAAKGLSTEMQYQAMAEAGLLSSSTKLTNTKLQSVLATQLESDAKAEEVMASMGLTVAKEGEDAVIVKLTAKKLQEAVASGVLTEAQAQELAMTLGVTTATNAQAVSVIPAWIAKMKAMTAAVWAQVKATAVWLATNPVGWAIIGVTAIYGISRAVSYYNKKQEEAKQKIKELGETARNEFKNIQNNLKSTISKVDEVKQRYAQLAQGVENLGKANQSRGTLTADDYNEFLDISNELSDLFPTLTQGYDDNGNAILNLNGNIQTITSSLNGLVEAQKAVAAQDMKKQMPDIYKDYKQTVTDYANEYNEKQVQANIAKSLAENGDISNLYRTSTDFQGNLYNGLLRAGIDKTTASNIIHNDSGQSLDDFDEGTQEKIKGVFQDLYKKYSKEVSDLGDKIEQENSKFGLEVSQTLYDNATYQDIANKDTTKKTIIDAIVHKLGYDTFTYGFGGDEFDEMYSKNIEEQIINAIDDIDDDEVVDALNKVLAGDISAADYKKYTQIIQDYDNSDTSIDFSKWFNFNTDEAEIVKSAKAAKDRIQSVLSEEGISVNDNSQENLQSEYEKISNWGLDDYADQIKNNTIQTKFGNVDMDKRTIIHWSDELKQTYADALASWDYDPEVGSIDTVFGGSERFGEELNGNGWEVAFTPILPDGTFLSKDTVEEYINSILEEAYADDGKVTEDELIAIDAQGRQVGNTFVQGIFAGIDDSQNYDNNGNWAEVVGRLMHFSGKYGAVQLAQNNISSIIDNFTSSLTPEQLDIFSNIKIDDKSLKILSEKGATEFVEYLTEQIEQKTSEVDLNVSDIFSQYSDATTKLINLFDKGLLSTDKIKDGILTLNNTKFNLTSIQGYSELLQECGNDVDTLISKIQELANGSASAYDSINNTSNIKAGLDKLSTVYSDKMSGTNFVDAVDLTSLYDQFGDLDVFDTFISKMTDMNATAKESQQVFDDLATSYIDSKYPISELTESNKDYTIAALKKLGVQNAEEAVTERLSSMEDLRSNAYSELNQKLNESAEAEKLSALMKQYNITTSESLANCTASEIAALMNAASAAGIETSSLKTLWATKRNATQLDLSASINDLLAEAEAAGVTSSALNILKAVQNGSQYIPPAELERIKQEAAKAIRQSAADYKIDLPRYHYTGGGGSSGGGNSGGGNSGGGSNTKTPYDKLEEWLNKLFDWISIKISRIERLINKATTKAESYLNEKKYGASSSQYISAIDRTLEEIGIQRQGASKYNQTADKILSEAVKDGVISKSSADFIKKNVPTGMINISEYSDEVRKVIEDYKEWYEKSLDCTDAIQTLHDKLSDYIKSLKEVTDAQRDAKISQNELKQALNDSGIVYTRNKKAQQLDYEYAISGSDYKAYKDATDKNVENVKTLGDKAIKFKTSNKQIVNNAVINRVNQYIANKRAISDADMDSILEATKEGSGNSIDKRNAYKQLYEYLVAYNKAIDNYETAKQEQITKLLEYSELYFNNTAEKYKNIEEEFNNTIDEYNNSLETTRVGTVSAKSKNEILDKITAKYKSIVANNEEEIKAYQSKISDSRNSIKNLITKTKWHGETYTDTAYVQYNGKATYVNDYISKINQNYVNKGEAIPITEMTTLQQLTSQGVISADLFAAYVQYNNALEAVAQAEAQKKVNQQTYEQQKTANAIAKAGNIKTEEENKIGRFTNAQTRLNNRISVAEAQGHVTAEKYYNGLADQEKKTNKQLKEERDRLISNLNTSIKDGSIINGSTEWYQLIDQIDDVTNSIDQSNLSLINFQNQIRQLKWDRFDNLLDKLSNVHDELEFIQTELSREDLTDDDTGNFTDRGRAVLGLHSAQYTAYNNEAAKYKEEIEKINQELATDGNDTNKDLLDRKQELIKSYQDTIKSAQDEKYAVIDLYKDGYDALKSHISDLISEYNDLLSAQKDAYDYQQNLEDKVKTISDLRKQITALSGDVSEENRANLQTLTVNLADAEKSLKDSQYDQFISDTKDMLSDFQDDLDDAIQDIIDSLSDNFQNLVDKIDSNWSENVGTITDLLNKIGYNTELQINNSTSATDLALSSIQNIEALLKKQIENAEAEANKSDGNGTTVDKDGYISVPGHAGGAYRISKAHLAQLAEEGNELHLSAKTGVLKEVGENDKIFTHEMSENLWRLAQINPNLFERPTLKPINMPTRNVNSEQNLSINMGDINVSSNDPAEFANSMKEVIKSDSSVKKLIQDTGLSPLNKNFNSLR